MIKNRRERRFCLQQVLAGLDNQKIDTAVDQAAHLFTIGRAEVNKGDVTKRRQFAPGPHRAGHPTRLLLR